MCEERAILSESRSYCGECRGLHQSRYETQGGRVLYAIDCPRHPREEVVSRNAATFTSLRTRQEGSTPCGDSCALKFHFFIVAITDDCNFACPICFAQSGPGGKRSMAMEEFRRAAGQVRSQGGRRISISGGEPSLHPDLLEMIRWCRELGLSPTLVTNGLKIAEDPAFARGLKAAGLRRVHLQFDTLDNDVYRVMRGRSDTGEKRQAIENVRAAGLSLGLVTTVCDRNLPELERLLEYSQRLVPTLRIHVFQPAVPVGRFPHSMATVTREDVIESLARGSGRYTLEAADFLPFPPAASGRAAAHPDCSAHVLMCSDGNSSLPLRLASWNAPSRRGDADLSAGLNAADVLPAATIERLKSQRRRAREWHPFFVSIIAFMRPETRDEERLARCVVASVSEGYLVPLCAAGCGTRGGMPVPAASGDAAGG